MRSVNLVLASLCASIAAVAATETEILGGYSADEVYRGLQEGNCFWGTIIIGALQVWAGVSSNGLVNFVNNVFDLGNAAFLHADSAVYRDVIKLEAPVILEKLGKMSKSSQTASLLVTTLLGTCTYSKVDPHSGFLQFPKAKPKTARPAVSGQTPIQIVQYSDIHVDEAYQEDSDWNCNNPYCCRGNPNTTSFRAGPFGNRKCDVPQALEKSMYRAISERFPDANFTLFTGDIVNHFLWETTEEWNKGNITDAYQRMDLMGRSGNSFRHVYGTIGNHEAHPVNMFPTKGSPGGVSWVYDVVSKAWSRWLGTTATQVEKAGYYSAKYPHGKLRIISLNTNYYYKLNWWMYQDPMLEDPDGQFDWLIKELQDAEDNGDRVYIIGHMPMGSDDTFHMYSHYFDQIVNRYENTIAALFFGHTHMDEIQLAYRAHDTKPSYSLASAVSYVCPALHPGDGNPTFRVYNVDPVTFAVLDSTTYYADMNAVDYQKGPQWQVLYSAKQAYNSAPAKAGPKDELSPAWWHNVTESFAQDNKQMQLYLSHKKRGYKDPKVSSACNQECVKNEVCQMQAMRAEDNCQTPGFHFTKRDLAADEDTSDDTDDSPNEDMNEDWMDHDHDQCGMSAMAMAFGEIVHNRTLFDMFVDTLNKTVNGDGQGSTNGTANNTVPSNSTSASKIHRPILKARDDVLALLLNREY